MAATAPQLRASCGPNLTRQQALELQDAFIAEYSKDAFQERLREALERAAGNAKLQLKAKQELLVPVQDVVLAKFGFTGTKAGVMQTIAALAQVETDTEVADKNRTLAHLVNPSAAAKSKASDGTGRAPPAGPAPGAVLPRTAPSAAPPPASKFPGDGPLSGAGAAPPASASRSPPLVDPPSAEKVSINQAWNTEAAEPASSKPTTRSPAAVDTISSAKPPLDDVPPKSTNVEEPAAQSRPAASKASTAAPADSPAVASSIATQQAAAPRGAPAPGKLPATNATIPPTDVEDSPTKAGGAAAPVPKDAPAKWTGGIPPLQKYSLETYEPGDGQLWVVVGGAAAGGIVVRKDKEVQSKELQFRLQYGARVEELEIVGERLHYRRLLGDGPDFGWVSISVKGTRLLTKITLEDFRAASGASR